MKTRIINIFGGPGIGKSTLAAGIHYNLKLIGAESVMIHEEYKASALANHKPSKHEQFQIFARQVMNEERFYGGAEFIVTDAPLELNAFYNDSRFPTPSYTWMVKGLRDEYDIHTENYLLDRTLPYNEEGRYQDKGQALEVDFDLKNYLLKYQINHTEVNTLEPLWFINDFAVFDLSELIKDEQP